MKTLNFIIPLVIYPFDVMVSFGQTDIQLKKSLQKVGSEWDNEMKCEGSGRFCMNKFNQSIIRLAKYPEKISDMGTIAHEIFHCVTHVMGRIGMKLILSKSDEAYSYLIGYLTVEIFGRLEIDKILSSK